MRKMCHGRLTLQSEGCGGQTTLTCVMSAVHLKDHEQQFVSNNNYNTNNSPRISSHKINNSTTSNISNTSNTSTTASRTNGMARPNETPNLWDGILVKVLLEAQGIVIVEDSRALAIQIKRGLARSHEITNVRTLCGGKAKRYVFKRCRSNVVCNYR